MAGPPVIIRKKRVCPEHMCNIFAEMRIMERVASGNLDLERIEVRQEQKPWVDRQGKLLVANEQNLIRDYRFPTDDPRHKVAKTHRHLTDTGEPGASGKHDPKSITTPDGVRYLLLPDADSTCELCESGDMIHPDDRFQDSIYKPTK